MYEAETEAVVRARCRLHDLLRKLFCDLEKGKKFVAHVQKSCTRTRAEMNSGVIRFRLIANSQIAT
jgi:hypothetical protein